MTSTLLLPTSLSTKQDISDLWKYYLSSGHNLYIVSKYSLWKNEEKFYWERRITKDPMYFRGTDLNTFHRFVAHKKCKGYIQVDEFQRVIYEEDPYLSDVQHGHIPDLGDSKNIEEILMEAFVAKELQYIMISNLELVEDDFYCIFKYFKTEKDKDNYINRFDSTIYRESATFKAEKLSTKNLPQTFDTFQENMKMKMAI